ncbi:60S ribosomal protein L10-like [Sapajus apella]|uniref:60S ribosomal protein L10-like n=1 Tax=Sapajus apella TaxID=9515 RepID=A0A6J3JRZ4_SAPAP|nr:60S ribosomal protein L10-like [Sapajus apella]
MTLLRQHGNPGFFPPTTCLPATREHCPHCRLQTGMQGAFEKPQGTVARVRIGQVITFIHTKLQDKEHVIGALRRAMFKFPGLQKIHTSKKWSFTKFNADEFEDVVAEQQLIPDVYRVKHIPSHGPEEVASPMLMRASTVLPPINYAHQ